MRTFQYIINYHRQKRAKSINRRVIAHPLLAIFQIAKSLCPFPFSIKLVGFEIRDKQLATLLWLKFVAIIRAVYTFSFQVVPHVPSLYMPVKQDVIFFTRLRDIDRIMLVYNLVDKLFEAWYSRRQFDSLRHSWRYRARTPLSIKVLEHPTQLSTLTPNRTKNKKKGSHAAMNRSLNSTQIFWNHLKIFFNRR